MESFGNKLRQAREKLNLSVDQVSRDTHIAKRYIEGLEREDFSGFPGETYTTGFLRNYAILLGIDPNEMVTMYRNLRIQEQPVPMTELLEDRRRPSLKSLLLVAAVVVAVIAVAGGGYGVYRLVDSRRAADLQAAGPAAAAPSTTEGAVYVLQEPTVVRWFSQGDRITVPFGSLQVPITVLRIEKDVYLELPGGVDILATGDRKRLDLDNDGKIDLQIQLNSVDTTAGQRKANIGLYKIAKAADEPRVAGATEAEGLATETGGEERLAAPVRAMSRPVVTLREAEAVGPFALTVSFSGRSLFRFEVDDGERDTRLFLKGGTFQLEVDQKVKLWVSNAGVVDLRVAGKQLELGRQGEVASVDIRWVRDSQSRKQRLKSFPLY